MANQGINAAVALGDGAAPAAGNIPAVAAPVAAGNHPAVPAPAGAGNHATGAGNPGPLPAARPAWINRAQPPNQAPAAENNPPIDDPQVSKHTNRRKILRQSRLTNYISKGPLTQAVTGDRTMATAMADRDPLEENDIGPLPTVHSTPDPITSPVSTSGNDTLANLIYLESEESVYLTPVKKRKTDPTDSLTIYKQKVEIEINQLDVVIQNAIQEANRHNSENKNHTTATKVTYANALTQNVPVTDQNALSQQGFAEGRLPPDVIDTWRGVRGDSSESAKNKIRGE